jgi:hypothetical protein
MGLSESQKLTEVCQKTREHNGQFSAMKFMKVFVVSQMPEEFQIYAKLYPFYHVEESPNDTDYRRELNSYLIRNGAELNEMILFDEGCTGYPLPDPLP